MTQKEVDILFEIVAVVHQERYFGECKKRLSLKDTQKWVAEQLANCSLHIYTIPMGSSWSHLTTKEKYNEYYNS
jgi:hypothetical protein